MVNMQHRSRMIAFTDRINPTSAPSIKKYLSEKIAFFWNKMSRKKITFNFFLIYAEFFIKKMANKVF